MLQALWIIFLSLDDQGDPFQNFPRALGTLPPLPWLPISSVYIRDEPAAWNMAALT